MNKRAIAVAFSKGQFDKCMDYITTETIWDTPGEQCLHGRKEIEPFCTRTAAYFQSVETIFTQINVIEDEHGVAINGTQSHRNVPIPPHHPIPYGRCTATSQSHRNVPIAPQRPNRTATSPFHRKSPINYQSKDLYTAVM